MKKGNLLSKAEMKKVMGGSALGSSQCEIVGGYCRTGKSEECKEGYVPDAAADCSGCCIPR